MSGCSLHCKILCALLNVRCCCCCCCAREIRLIKNGGRWFFLMKYVLAILFWTLNTGLSAYAAGTLLVK